VPGDIGERLLRHAVDDQLDVWWQRGEIGSDLFGYLEAELLGEPIREHGQGAGQAEVVERLRSQLDRDPAHVLEARADRVLGLEQIGVQLLGHARLQP
jgi:hypothetical protein